MNNTQKEKELSRVMEKLHYEFFLKKESGHSRVQQAHENFYKAVADYKKLTGRDRPENFHFEELPPMDKGAVALQTDDADDSEEEQTPFTHFGGSNVADFQDNDPNVCIVPDEMPACMKQCAEDTAPECIGVSDTWSTTDHTDRCACYTKWIECALNGDSANSGQNGCTVAEMDTSCFNAALDEDHCDKCNADCSAESPSSSVYKSLHEDQLVTTPVGADAANDEGQTGDDDGGGDLLETDETHDGFSHDEEEHDGLRAHGIHLTPLLETKELDMFGKALPTGSMNPPTGCAVSHPDMLGDGNCDGGAYNTEACNFDGGDCCETDCRPAMHKCGVGGYQCLGAREGVRVNDEFKCDKGKVKKFSNLFDDLRNQLTRGDAMQSNKQCSHLTKEEHDNVAQGFNLGVELGYYAKTQSAAAQKGGPEFYVSCTLWDEEMGSDWFGTLVTHELGHLSGYSHPKFKGQVYYSECENIGSTYCHGHCMEWTRACENHLIFGSETCGFAGFGCKTRCVHSDYCYSLPERLTECFGYQKVHSRAESLSDRAGSAIESVTGFNPISWLFGGAWQHSLVLPLLLAFVFGTGGAGLL